MSKLLNIYLNGPRFIQVKPIMSYLIGLFPSSVYLQAINLTMTSNCLILLLSNNYRVSQIVPRDEGSSCYDLHVS